MVRQKAASSSPSTPVDAPGQPCQCQRSAQTNAGLVASCLAGDDGAWNALVSRYERLVYAIPLREGLSAHDAAEISQTTFEALVESLARIRDPERLGHWLMTVARRLSWRRRNTNRNEVMGFVTGFGEGLEDLVDDVDRWERTVTVYEAVADLGEPCRTVIFGLFFDPEEPSYDDIANVLGSAVGTIGPLRSRCLARLRSALETGQW